MMPLWRRAAGGAALAFASVVGLAAPGVAAPAHRSVQLQVCNDASNYRVVDALGYNHRNHYVEAMERIVEAKSCHTIRNWWWKTGQTMHFAVFYRTSPRPHNLGRYDTKCRIPWDRPHGSTFRCWV
jgi:hypothetical protein